MGYVRSCAVPCTRMSDEISIYLLILSFGPKMLLLV
jgi:hypothetical protein